MFRKYMVDERNDDDETRRRAREVKLKIVISLTTQYRLPTRRFEIFLIKMIEVGEFYVPSLPIW